METKQTPTSHADQDAIALLTADHQKVSKLFKKFDKLMKTDGDDGKKELVAQICTELTVHAQIEEEIFYPAAREAIDGDDLLDEAEVEHATAKDLITELESMQSGDALYDAKVTVLSEYIKHHVKEEQNEIFPKVRKAQIDLRALGEEMSERKQELLAKLGVNVSEQKQNKTARGARKTTGARN